jgi:predicted metal-dependent enzyme (double-stranded beta helix superfamily)
VRSASGFSTGPRDGSLSLFSLVVPAGSETPIHDHLAWGLVGLYRGEQDEEIYAREGEELRLVERRALHAGDFYALFPPHDDIHRVRTTSAEKSGLHPLAHERHRLHLAALVRPGDGR